MKPACLSYLRYSLALGSVILVCGCHPEKKATPSPPADAPIAVRTIRPLRGAITRSITLPGSVLAYQQATLYAKVAGYLKTITVDKGDEVKEGTLLADLEVPELLADRAKFRAELELAAIDYQRVSEAQKKAPDLVVPQSVDNAKGRLETARATLERTETLLNFARITAPFSGVITKRMVDPGAFIASATSGSVAQNAALLMLMDFSRVRIQVAVPESEAALVQKDQPVKVGVEGLPGRAFEGTITRFSYALDDASKTMLAEAELPNPSRELRPGMFATVTIGIEQRTNSLLVPVEALLVEKNRSSVFTVTDDAARKVTVKTGFNDGVSVEILEGVKLSDDVIVLGKLSLNDGQKVKVTEGK